MSKLKANELLDRWTEAANAGDIDGILALCEKGAAFFPEPGKRCQGVEEIRASLVPWFALNPKLEMKGIHFVECGDLTLSKSKWSLSATSPEGEPIAIGGVGTEVFRRQADGGWLFAIDDPFGPQ